MLADLESSSLTIAVSSQGSRGVIYVFPPHIKKESANRQLLALVHCLNDVNDASDSHVPVLMGNIMTATTRPTLLK